MAQMIDTTDGAAQQPQEASANRAAAADNDADDQMEVELQFNQEVESESDTLAERRSRRAVVHTNGTPYLFDTVKYMRLNQGFVYEMETTADNSLDEVNVLKRKFQFDKNFPSMNQYLQMPGDSESIWVTGGSGDDFKKKTFELVLRDDRLNYDVCPRAQMKYSRVFHSMCYLDTNTIYVSGSRDAADAKSVESYDISQNVWTTRAEMPQGRSRHASCSFQQRYIYVFCGWIDNHRSSNISHLDTEQSSNPVWQNVNCVPSNSLEFEERICPGVIQIDLHRIAIFGGYGKMNALKDYFELSPTPLTWEAKGNKTAEFGMELYYRKPCKMVSGDIVFGTDAGYEIYKIGERDPYYEVVADFEYALAVADDDI